MNELSLYTGVGGGGLLGTHLLGWTPKGYVEIDKHCQQVIAQRIADGILPLAPIYGDIRLFISEGYARAYQGMVDVVTAGFPCQGFSFAGKRLGERDPRNLWPETIEVIRQVRPRYVLLENVRGLLSSGYFPQILQDLAESGYDARWRVLSAAEVGAPHKRDRLWIVAYAQSERQPQQSNGDHRREEQRHSQEQSFSGAGSRGFGGHTAARDFRDQRTAAQVQTAVDDADSGRRQQRHTNKWAIPISDKGCAEMADANGA